MAKQLVFRQSGGQFYVHGAQHATSLRSRRPGFPIERIVLQRRRCSFFKRWWTSLPNQRHRVQTSYRRNRSKQEDDSEDSVDAA